MKGEAQTISMLSVDLQSCFTGGEGGVIFSEVNYLSIPGAIPQIKIDIAKHSAFAIPQKYTTMQASKQGSFLYVSSLNNPNVVLNIADTIMKCVNSDFCVD
jgi:hypothetical protein